MSNNKEYILCSAILYLDGKKYVSQPIDVEFGFVVCGRRHHNIINTLGQVFDYKTRSAIQGFITSKDRFVSRAEAYEIARDANQLLLGDYQSKPYMLTSEDIY